MKKILFTLLLCIISLTEIFAQKYSAGFNINIVEPRNNFKQNIKSLGGGISFFYLNRIKSTPLMIGGEIGGVEYASKTETKPYYKSGYPHGEAHFEESNGYFSYELVARFSPQSEKNIKPYAEAKAGGMSFYNNWSVSDPNYRTNLSCERETWESKTNLSGTSFVYSVGGGVKLNLSSLFDKNANCLPFYIDLGVSYSNGSSAKYGNCKSERTNEEGAKQYYFTSPLTMMNYRLGLSIDW